MQQLLFPLILFALMWLLLIRPQQQKARRQAELVRTIEVGDEVMTTGGMYGTVVDLDDETMSLKVDTSTTIRMVRGAVLRRVDGDMPAGGTP